MRLINASAHILKEELLDLQSFEGLDHKTRIAALLTNIFLDIERAGRTCYKLEDKITDNSVENFVEMLCNRKHYTMLEHGTVYLTITGDDPDLIGEKYINNKYSKVIISSDWCNYYVTTNYRVIVENGWLKDLQYLSEPTEFHEKRISIKFVCDQGISHELVRHRVFSFAQESTRYCNYSKDKFGSELIFVLPVWMSEHPRFKGQDLNESAFIISDIGYGPDPHFIFLLGLGYAESQYFKLLGAGWQPQQARSILPNSLKTEVIMTGFVSDWKEFFVLCTATAAHPQLRELVMPLYNHFK